MVSGISLAKNKGFKALIIIFLFTKPLSLKMLKYVL